MCPSPPRGARTAPGRALANLCGWGPGGQIYRCAAGRHLRAPGRTGTHPGANGIYRSRVIRAVSWLGP
eukprot:scaffold75347_cov37-Phaeocystis_antarctica.AAC.1